MATCPALGGRENPPMADVVSISDPRRTIDACRLNGEVHWAKLGSRHSLWTTCGKPVARDELLILRQRPEDITCPDCLKIMSGRH